MDPTVNRRGSSGGGQSSLGYLFGSESDNTQPPISPPLATVKPAPPYGLDSTADEDKPKINITVLSNNNYQRAQGGPNSGKFITDRPTTRVKSVPGGGSSLGYLFGDKP